MYDQITNPAHQWKMVSEEYIAKPGVLAGWLECARTDREPSAYFLSISTAELVELLFGAQATAEQRDNAVQIIRTRFFKEHTEEIARLCTEELQ
jgi:hypothetical protein